MNQSDNITEKNEEKKPRFGLLPRILTAIIVGILAGMVAPLWLGALCATFNGLFSQLLGFLVPLIIVGFVTPAIAEIGKKAGSMLAFTVALAYVATIIAGLTSYAICDYTFPSLINSAESVTAADSSSEAIAPWFEISIPPLMSVMTALVTAFMLGLGIAYGKAKSMLDIASEFRAIMVRTINGIVIPLLPFYIFGIFFNMTLTGEVWTIIMAFLKVIAVIFGIHIFVLLMQFTVASLFNGRNPLKMLGTMMPAYFTALGTQSSAATIPVTLRQTIRMGVSEEVAGFTVPLCATIHMSGSTLKLVACSMALMIMQGIPYDFPLFLNFICMVAITIVAAPGIPGGAIMASLGLLSSILGFTESQNALMIALYIAMDSFGTACNVTGDGALSVIVDRFFGKREATNVALN